MSEPRERVTRKCPRCGGTGEIHGEFRFEIGDAVRVQHAGRRFEGEIIERFMSPSHYGHELIDTYDVRFTLKSGEERVRRFGSMTSVSSASLAPRDT